MIDDCDRIIHATTAKTPRGVEIQIWTGLHNSSAYHAEEENAILREDLAWIEANASAFDWDALPMIAALRSLRLMGA